MTCLRWITLCLWGILGQVVQANTTMAANPPQKVFPGAVGFGVETPAGRGGRVIKVVNLNADGPGSFAVAVHAKGPRIVVFEVGGAIDLDRKTLTIAEPFVTIAGQTAPSPGISFIRGGISIRTHDVLVQHIRVRTGDAGMPKRCGWEPDALSTAGPDAWNIVVDHCSLAWSIDENLSASGSRFTGADVEEWRKHTTHDTTFSHSIIAEGLHQASHTKGGHSKGTLVHDNVTRMAIVGNLYSCNVERNPLFKGGVRGVVVNNFISNPQSRAVHYGLLSSEWGNHPYVTGQMALVGNVLQHGPSTSPTMPLFELRSAGPMELYAKDNLAWKKDGQPAELYRSKDPRLLLRIEAAPLWPEGLQPLPAAQVRETVLKNAGARPWDRDSVDERIVRQARDNTGRILDSQDEVGGYPQAASTHRVLDVPQENVEAWLQSFCKSQ